MFCIIYTNRAIEDEVLSNRMASLLSHGWPTFQ